MLKRLFFIFLLLPATVFSQFKITGKVIDSSTNAPVEDVSVFINNSTIGAISSPDGSFVLTGLKNGKYDLIISIIGYTTIKQNIAIDNKDLNLHTISIIPLSKQLKEVVIKPHPVNTPWLIMFKKH